MRVNPIRSTSFRGYNIKADENRHIKYLYNEVSDAIYKQGITTTFTPKEIRLDRLTDPIKKRLEELKIVFTKEKK